MIKLNYLTLISLLVLMACGNDKSENPSPTGNAPDTSGFTNNTTVTDGSGNVYSIGFTQASSNNQNPYVEKKDASGGQIWRVTYENTGVDGRGVFITLDADGNPWATFTVDGGSNDNGYISKKEIETNAFSGVFQNNYGSGGGAKITVIARLNPSTGKIVKGTFVPARLTNGNTNTLNITKIGFANGNFAFEISSAAWPPNTGTSYSIFPDITDNDRVGGSFKIYYEINTNLSEILKAVLLTE